MKSYKLSLQIRRFFIYIIMIIITLLAIVPIYTMLINATRSTEQINNGLSLIPGTNLLYNWNALTSRGFQISQGFINSAIIALSSTVLCVYFSAMTAYGVHVYKFKGRNLLWTIILLIMNYSFL